MKIFWWETGIQIEPESQAETAALRLLLDSINRSAPDSFERKKPGQGQSLTSRLQDGPELLVANQ